MRSHADEGYTSRVRPCPPLSSAHMPRPLHDLIRQAQHTNEPVGIIVCVGGSILDGMVGPQSSDELLVLTKARILDASPEPRRAIPDANIPTANIAWWSESLSHRLTPKEAAERQIKRSIAEQLLPVPDGPATVLVQGTIITGVAKGIDVDIPPPNDFPLSSDEKSELSEVAARALRERYVLMTEAKIVVGTQLVPSGSTTTVVSIDRRSISAWMPGRLSFG